MIPTYKFEKVEIQSQDELRSWLMDHYMQEESVWLVTWKKESGAKYVSVSQVLDELLSFGWIDGIRRKLDEERTMQLISPRKTQHWAETYKRRVAKLIDEGKMHPSGLAAVATSKENGLWDFMDDVDRLIIPDDLKTALKNETEAFEFFDAINPSGKRFALRWLKLAKTEKTRKARIEKLVQLSKKGEKLPGS
jgi:uncharacterized protein YdeI (YjbR/CyaY-like superfamily)